MKILQKNNIFLRTYNLIKHLKSPAASKRYIKHNQSLFIKNTPKKNNNPVVLFELNESRSSHIAYSYLANRLAKKHNAQIIAYKPYPTAGLKESLIYKIQKLLNNDHIGIYRSFNAASIFQPKANQEQKKEAAITTEKILASLSNTGDIENIVINGSWIGDLIYDTYLRTYTLPTINIDSALFKEHLKKSITLFIVWEQFFNANNIKAINISHCVYNLAIPLRIAIKKDIAVYQATITHLYRVKESNLFAYNDFHYFPEKFLKLPQKVQNWGLKEAKRRIDRRFAGEVGVDMSYSQKSAYSDSRHEQLIHPSSRKKILIATHCFFDSPHSYGKNLFPDFYEWLHFLGKTSKKTDYDWYIKTHPDYIQGTKEIIEDFIQHYPEFKLLPSDSSHHQIIAEGIDVALTVYGTIGFEYAALGIPVINASLNNPHIAYNFNIHPKSIRDYESQLLNLDNLDFSIDKRQIYEYYFMNFIFNTDNLFLNNYEKTIESIGGYYGQFEPKIYDTWKKEFTQEKHTTICKALDTFIESGNFRMDYSHFGEEFTMENIEASL